MRVNSVSIQILFKCMFNFFSRKKHLIDHLNGFVDIHNHILPGIDDGAKSVEDSLTLIKEFSSFGVKRMIATPHIMNNYYPNNNQTISAALKKLKDALTKDNISDFFIEASAEHMIDDNYENLLERNAVMPMKGNYILVEMSYLQPPINFEEAITKTSEQRYFPILAHPERYGFLHFRKRKYNYLLWSSWSGYSCFKCYYDDYSFLFKQIFNFKSITTKSNNYRMWFAKWYTCYCCS